MPDPVIQSLGAQAMDECWEALPEQTLVEQSWPKRESISAMQALQRWVPEQWENLAMRHAMARRFGVAPIVAVVGLLNSGKSSLTASFLAEGSRARVLRGVGNEQGSQRFTLWLPQAWKEAPAYYQNLLNLLTRVFAHEPEELASDPEAAWRQQNDVRALAKPLIATDANLDTHGLGLLDCPDIQRARTEDFRTRLDVVSRAAELCAAVLVVFARSQMEICDLAEIVAQMPEAHRLYAVNLLRREPADKVRREALAVLNLPENALVYGAYDFLAASYEEATPAWDWNRPKDRTQRLEASQPCFFELKPEPAANAPAAVGKERSLLSLAEQIAPYAMQSRRAQELGRSFFASLRAGLDGVQAKLAESDKELAGAQAKLLDECRYLVSQGDTLRIKMSPEIVASIEQSLSRTANFYYKWFLLPPRRFLQGAEKLLKKGLGLAALRSELKDKKEELERRLRVRAEEALSAGAIGPESLQRMLSLWSGATGDYQGPEFWKADAETILRRFIEEDKTNLSDAEWDGITTALWEQVPRRARVQIFSSVFLMLGSLALAFFDGGVSFVTLRAADLLGGIGLAASLGINLQGTSAFQKTLEEKLGLQQVANFYAVACDVIGLPRARPASLPTPTVEEKPQPQSYGARVREWSRHEIRQDTLTKLREHGF